MTTTENTKRLEKEARNRGTLSGSGQENINRGSATILREVYSGRCEEANDTRGLSLHHEARSTKTPSKDIQGDGRLLWHKSQIEGRREGECSVLHIFWGGHTKAPARRLRGSVGTGE